MHYERTPRCTRWSWVSANKQDGHAVEFGRSSPSASRLREPIWASFLDRNCRDSREELRALLESLVPRRFVNKMIKRSTFIFAVLCFLALACSARQSQSTSGWVYMKSFKNGTFTFVGSDHKTYRTRCGKVDFPVGRNSGPASDVCLITGAAVGRCTPTTGKDTGTSVFDGARATLSAEKTELEGVYPSTETEFKSARKVCSKEKWYHGK